MLVHVSKDCSNDVAFCEPLAVQLTTLHAPRLHSRIRNAFLFSSALYHFVEGKWLQWGPGKFDSRDPCLPSAPNRSKFACGLFCFVVLLTQLPLHKSRHPASLSSSSQPLTILDLILNWRWRRRTGDFTWNPLQPAGGVDMLQKMTGGSAAESYLVVMLEMPNLRDLSDTASESGLLLLHSEPQISRQVSEPHS